MATRQAVHQAMYNYKTSCPPGMEQLQGAMLQDTPDTNSLVAFASAVANKMLVTICLVSLACVGHLKLVKPQEPYLVSLRVVFSGWNDSLLLLRGASWQAKEVLHQARPPVQGPLGQLPTHGLLHCVLDDLVYVIMHHSAGRDTVWQRHCLAETLSGRDTVWQRHCLRHCPAYSICKDPMLRKKVSGHSRAEKAHT